MRVLKRLYQRTLEPTRRKILGALFKRKRAEYKMSILHTKRASFRRFISDGLVTDRLGQVVEMTRGKWRREVPVTLVLSSGDKVSTWEEFQDGLAIYHFLQTDEASQFSNIRIGEAD